MVRIVIVTGLVLAGCATTARSLKPMQMAAHAEEIVRDGSVVVPTEAGDVQVEADDVVDVRLRDVGGTEHPYRLTVRSLVEGCTTDVTSPACAAGRAVEDPVLTKRKVRFDPDKLVAMITVSAIGGGIGWCTVACEDPDRDLQRGGLIAGGVVVGSFALMTLLMLGMD